MTIRSKAAKALLGKLLCTKSINVCEDIRELGVFCILKHIPRVCGPTHVMPTCMNFFYRIVDQESFVMVRSIHCERPLFSSKTVGKNAKQVSVRASL